MNRYAVFFLMAAVIFFASCKSAPQIVGAESDAEVVYRQGRHFFERGDYNEAEKYFMRVISEFSFSIYEPFATVALADTFFQKKEYPSALEVYRRFVKMRPGHERTPWAEFQIGNCFFEQRPSDFILLPHPSEKDIEVVEKAADQYRHFLRKYPENEYRNSVMEMLERAEAILIERDLRVAEYYRKRRKCPAVRMRLKHISDNFTITTEKNRKRVASLAASCPDNNEMEAEVSAEQPNE